MDDILRASVIVEAFVGYGGDHRLLGPATGFFVNYQDRRYLVSNWHVFATRSLFDGTPLFKQGLADHLAVRIPTSDPTRWVRSFYPLASDEANNWHSPPRHRGIDLGIMPVETPENTRPFDVALGALAVERLVRPGDRVRMVGFPFGMESNGYPICKTAFLATDLRHNHNNRPYTLIDGTTREGMSGSPVFVAPAEGGAEGATGGLLGVYAAQHQTETSDGRRFPELGLVVKVDALVRLLKESNETEPVRPVHRETVRAGR